MTLIKSTLPDDTLATSLNPVIC